jgi:hypothetical protein
MVGGRGSGNPDARPLELGGDHAPATKPQNATAIVLTASAHSLPGISERQQIAIENLWKTMHSELAALSSEGLDRPAACSTPFIQLDCPSIVIGAINEIISLARGIRSLQPAPSAAPVAKP